MPSVAPVMRMFFAVVGWFMFFQQYAQYSRYLVRKIWLYMLGNFFGITTGGSFLIYLGAMQLAERAFPFDQ